MLNKVHKAQRVVIRKKRARAYVDWAIQDWYVKGRLTRRRKLRLIRQTRFNSHCQSLDAFLVNASLMRGLLDGQHDFKQAMAARTAEKQAKVDAQLKAWASDATFERARRALVILGPVATLCRQVATRDFFGSLPSFLRARRSITQAVEKEDFCDNTKRETGPVDSSCTPVAENSQCFFWRLQKAFGCVDLCFGKNNQNAFFCVEKMHAAVGMPILPFLGNRNI